ncbi:hypothetical protein MIR68_003014 [Amoeboaphelidium protococcarum]|nr:hypothetical protein MIR68_003014 [Amoeboaphelidium protococcarum]
MYTASLLWLLSASFFGRLYCNPTGYDRAHGVLQDLVDPNEFSFDVFTDLPLDFQKHIFQQIDDPKLALVNQIARQAWEKRSLDDKIRIAVESNKVPQMLIHLLKSGNTDRARQLFQAPLTLDLFGDEIGDAICRYGDSAIIQDWLTNLPGDQKGPSLLNCWLTSISGKNSRESMLTILNSQPDFGVNNFLEAAVTSTNPDKFYHMISLLQDDIDQTIWAKLPLFIITRQGDFTGNFQAFLDAKPVTSDLIYQKMLEDIWMTTFQYQNIHVWKFVARTPELRNVEAMSLGLKVGMLMSNLESIQSSIRRKQLTQETWRQYLLQMAHDENRGWESFAYLVQCPLTTVEGWLAVIQNGEPFTIVTGWTHQISC